MNRARWLVEFVGWMGLAGCLSAQAQTVNSLAATGSAAMFGFDGLTFAISNCTSTVTGACSAVKMVAVSTSGGAEIEFLGNGGAFGSNILSVTNGSGNYQTDFKLTVTGTSRTNISSVMATVTGGTAAQIGASLALNGVSNCTTTGGYASGQNCTDWPVGSGENATTTFNRVSSLSVNYALGLNASLGQTVTLSTATATFSPVPEPASTAVLAAGLAGLAAARKRRRPG